MTTTDARGWITALIKAMHEETSGSWPDPEYKDEVYSALEMAIQALSQEPCDDTVSRDAVLNAICDYVALGEFSDKSRTFTVRPLEKRINELPSVTQKSGKWLLTHLSNMAYCSECDYLFKDIPASIVEHFKHCPNCGAYMAESEDKK